MSRIDFSIGMGGEAGDGSGSAGDVLAFVLARRGIHLNTYNAYQSIVRGGHILLTIRASDRPVYTHGDKLDVLICLNQDTMDRHLKLMKAGSAVIYNSDKVKPGTPAAGVQMCPIPVKEVSANSPNKLIQNTMAVSVVLNLLGVEFEPLEAALTRQFKRKGDKVVAENVGPAKAAYEYASQHFKPFSVKVPNLGKGLCFISGNEAFALAGAAAGVKFYAAYPMSPSTGVLMWFAKHAKQLGIVVRQIEDEIGVMNIIVGAGHAGARAMCATSGGGFALMTEALGMAAMLEVPCICINVQRGGPATGLPTKTEQADLWQALGAGQGDYPRVVVAPTTIPDCYNTIPELFNLVDKLQCPGIVLSDLLISEGRSTIEPSGINLAPKIDRGELILPNGQHDGINPLGGYNDGTYLRYKITESGVSPRAVPGTPGHIHIAPTDEHAEDGTLVSDEYTDPHKRVQMMEKRMRKMKDAHKLVPAPKLFGPENAQVTLVGWGSTEGVIREAIERLAAEEGIVANNLQIKWIVPFHADEITKILSKSKKIIIVENNYSGQFARYLRSETSIVGHGHIRKYDGEPLQPHHVIEAVKKQLAGKENLSVPAHEIQV